MQLLIPPLNQQAPIKLLERLWLESSAAYAEANENIIDDTLWDALAVELWERRQELSPYFTHATGLPWPVSLEHAEEGENPLKTTLGVNWRVGTAGVFLQRLQAEGVPKRAAWWSKRLGQKF